MRLYILPLGGCDCDKGRVLTAGSGEGERVIAPIWAALVQVGGLNILIDTGMHPIHIQDPQATFRHTPHVDLIVPVMNERDRIENRLAEIGLGPEDVHFVVNTHLHFDHAGSNYLFSRSVILVQRDHYQQACDTLGSYQSQYWHLPDLTYELVEGDLNLVTGVQVVKVPGHVKGLQVPVIRLPDAGVMVLAGDAISMEENLREDRWEGSWNPTKARVSARRLAAIAEAEGGTLVFGHDPEFWKTLKLSPEYYT
jgi:N-acyl homoserine lactone hydrolase